MAEVTAVGGKIVVSSVVVGGPITTTSVRAYVPAGASLTVPSRYVVPVGDQYEIDSDGTLILEQGAALLVG